jgi:hypothetical protein
MCGWRVNFYDSITWYLEQRVEYTVVCAATCGSGEMLYMQASQLYGCIKWYHEQCVDTMVCVLRLAVQAK